MLPLRMVDHPTDRAGVEVEIRGDRFQGVGARDKCCCHGRTFVAVCLGKRLQRRGHRLSLHLRELVAALHRPQPRLYVGHKRKKGSANGSHGFPMASYRVAPGGSLPAVRLVPGARVAKGDLNSLAAFHLVDC
jgi:hypothetical protein